MSDTVDPIPNQPEQQNHSDSDQSTDEEDNTFQNPRGYVGYAPVSPSMEVPRPQFYNFEAKKSLDKLKVGQVWAVYCDEDNLPKYYGLIKKIDLMPEHIVHVAWLGTVASTGPSTMIQWKDKKIPITCGRFKVRRMRESQYTSLKSFSHQVRVRKEGTSRREEYVIMPRKGEVWALYKNWNFETMKCSELFFCKYDLVMVVEEDHSGISVLRLEVVGGYNCVARAQVKGLQPGTLKIPRNELLRFSHQVPSHELTVEGRGALRGYVELDPKAMPNFWFQHAKEGARS